MQKQLHLPFGAFVLLSLILWCCEPNTPSGNSLTEMDNLTPEAISLDGRPLYPMKESPGSLQKKDSLWEVARNQYDVDSTSLENIIWYGRRLAYLSRYQEAMEVFSKGIALHPSAPELYRHRGHRFISTRQLEKAKADFETAAKLAADLPVTIEPDGQPNRQNIPLSNLQFNIWYHWGLTHYLLGNFQEAARIYEECMRYSNNPDLVCATADWLYMTYRRLGQQTSADSVLTLIQPDMTIIENDAYFNRLLMYKGLKKPEDLLDLDNTGEDQVLNVVTQGYGVGNWYLYNGDKAKAMEIFQKIIDTNYWAAFGFIAAEAELAREKEQ